MSTSLETSRSPLPSNKAKLARAFLAAAGAFVAFQVLAEPLVSAAAHVWYGLEQRRSERAALEPMIEKARLWRVDYETAREGDYVVWCVDHPASGYSYLAGKPSQPLVLSNDWQMETNSPQQGGRCTDIVARVEGRKPQGVVLRFMGLP